MGFKAGTASICITPDEPLWLAGYAARTEPARGTLSDLFASALALEDCDGERCVMVSADLIAIPKILAEPIAERVAREAALPRQRLLLAGTHTHYAPEFRPDKQLFFNIPSEYAAHFARVGQTLIDAISRVILDALQRLEPARLIARSTTATFAHNRRRTGVVDGEASTEDRFDHEVPVLDIVDSAGRHKAIVYGYACHNTTLPWEDCRYCADWVGEARQRLRSVHGDCTVLFLPGAGADQNPDPRGSIELSQRYGDELGHSLLACLQREGREIHGRIAVAREEVELALEPVTREKLGAMLASDDPPKRVKAQFLLDQLARGEALISSYAAPVQVARFGDQMLMVALSGEPVVDWAHHFRQILAREAPLIWVAGYCNDMFGYVPTRRLQREGGYEGGRAYLWSWIPMPMADDLEDRVTAAVQRLVRAVSQR
jgi:neutral ceramidase